MSKFIIDGGNKICGEYSVECAKNAYLPIIAATILCEEQVVLKSCPNFSDINNMILILKNFGMNAERKGQDLYINGKDANECCIPTDLAKVVRSSIFALGALLGRFKKAKVAYPGGCDIGLRPINLHLKGLKDLGVKIIESHGYIYCDASKMHGGQIYLDYPSVGATENLMMAGVLCKGKTVIFNPAKEPEIIDLRNFLNAMGAKIEGAGTDYITIIGVEKLNGVEYKPIPDRIIAGTMLISAAITGGKILLKDCIPQHFSSLYTKLQKSGCKIDVKNDSIMLESSGKLNSVGFLDTMPYPGFPTDLQAQMLTLQTVAKGTCLIQENMFESRFKFVPELIKMGANVRVHQRTAFVTGVSSLLGADVFATDLRGGVALVLAGLCAKGYTTVHDIYHIDRGYSEIEKTLTCLGASIKRVE